MGFKTNAEVDAEVIALRDRLIKHLNDNPLDGQDGRVDAIDGEPAIGLEIDDELYFLTVTSA